MEEKKSLFRSESFLCYLVLCATLLTATLVPLVGAIALFMIPAALIYCRIRLKVGHYVTVSAMSLATTLAAVNISDSHANLSVLLSLFISSLIIPEIVLKRYSLEKTVLLSSVSLISTGLVFMILRSTASGNSPWEITERYVRAIIDENIRIYEYLNVPAEQLQSLRENAAEIVSFFTAITPAMFSSASIVVVWANIMAVRGALKRSELLAAFPDFGDLSLWKAPDNLIWLFIISAASTLILEGIPSLVGMNLLIICCAIYFLQGLAIASYFFKQKRIPPVIHYLFYFLLAIQHYLVILVIVVGLFDLWVDFRKRISKATDGNT